MGKCSGRGEISLTPRNELLLGKRWIAFLACSPWRVFVWVASSARHWQGFFLGRVGSNIVFRARHA